MLSVCVGVKMGEGAKGCRLLGFALCRCFFLRRVLFSTKTHLQPPLPSPPKQPRTHTHHHHYLITTTITKPQIVPPAEIYEGVAAPREQNPFARLARGGGGARSPFPYDRPEVDFADPRPYERQLFDQVLLDDPDVPGYQPALPRGFDIEKLAREVEREGKQSGGGR